MKDNQVKRMNVARQQLLNIIPRNVVDEIAREFKVCDNPQSVARQDINWYITERWNTEISDRVFSAINTILKG